MQKRFSDMSASLHWEHLCKSFQRKGMEPAGPDLSLSFLCFLVCFPVYTLHGKFSIRESSDLRCVRFQLPPFCTMLKKFIKSTSQFLGQPTVCRILNRSPHLEWYR